MCLPPMRLPERSSRRALPAMVLVEVLVGAAIIAAVVGLFLAVLVDAGATIGRTRDRTRELLIASRVLREIQAAWPLGPSSGNAVGYGWTVSCVDPPGIKSVRLALVECTVRVSRLGSGQTRPDVIEHAAWPAPAQPPSLP